jgi:hypothetical protein
MSVTEGVVSHPCSAKPIGPPNNRSHESQKKLPRDAVLNMTVSVPGGSISGDALGPFQERR